VKVGAQIKARTPAIVHAARTAMKTSAAKIEAARNEATIVPEQTMEALISEFRAHLEVGPMHALGHHDNCDPNNCKSVRPISQLILDRFNGHIDFFFPNDDVGNLEKELKEVMHSY
jgi:hypothetical protein